jgi:AcrR family transcriptional regulator
LSRPRNAALTRDAILRAAVRAFSQASYDAVGVRQVAEDAGVTAMLVNRYFGSKEALFAAVVDAVFGEAHFADASAETLAEMLVTKVNSAEGNAVLVLLHSASHPVAGEVLRMAIERRYESPLATALKGKDAHMRAALLLAVIAGVQLLRDVVGVRALAKADRRRLAAMLTAALER